MAAAAGPEAGPMIPMLAPPLRRRMAAWVYEAVLLFGVVMLAGLVYGVLTQQRHALQGHLGLQVFVFIVLGLYFVWFWTHGGQTVAAKAWQLKIVDASGQPLRTGRAMLRYLLSWLWLLPAWSALWLAGMPSTMAFVGLTLFGVAAWASLVYLRPDRQFWHDAVAGTRVVHAPPPVHRRPAAPRTSR